MEKLKLSTNDNIEKNINFISSHFPQCMVESIVDNKIISTIDFDLLKQELSDHIVDGTKERYRFEWPGKKEALLKSNEPIQKTLRPHITDSLFFDRTKNIYVEGDNLDVLKLLQESYLNKIKVIYIDPPYNTGNNFIYKDNFTQDKGMELEESGQIDEYNNKLVKNQESNGRFHSDWLSMMYSRIRIAKNLLKNDGVIFISIDDNEVHNLRKICDEIFGENNFIDIFNWAKTETPANLSKKSKKVIEYILCYQKSKNDIKFRGKVKESLSSNGLLNQTNKVGKLIFPKDIVVTNIEDGLVKKGTYGTDSYVINLLEDTEVKNGLFVKEIHLEAKFKWTQDKLNEEIKRGTQIKIPTIRLSPSYEKSEYEPEVPPNLINSKVEVGTNENAGVHLSKIFGKKVFDFPKPVNLLKYLINFNIEENDICLDFFSGSGTLAEAVMEISLETKIRYICVQIPEELDIKNGRTEAEREIIQNAIDFLKAHAKTTNLCELAKERIRRAGAKILEENKDKEGIENLDIGFRVFKVDSSNMKDVYYNPDEIRQDNLFEMISNIKDGRTDLDLLFQVLLDSGVELTLPIEEKQIVGKKVYFVDGNVLAACFEDNLTEEFVTELSKCEDLLKVVFRDSSFGSDDSRINVEQIFKQYSPDTQIRVI
jgi:adenine-specific DNA-methyltransferase